MTKPWLPLTPSRPAPPPPPLGPLMAGARARGVADGFSWLGLAAILIDDRGEAMHVNSGAVELMGEALYLENGRLRIADAHADAELAEAIRAAIDDGITTAIRAPKQDGEVVVHVAAMPAGDDDPFQLLRAVALLRVLSARH